MTSPASYWNHDTQRMEPCIPSTLENWENGTLGRDERYVQVVSRAQEDQIQQALGLPPRR